MTPQQLKTDAARLARHLQQKFGFRLRHAASLEATAISRGFKDWNTCLALSPPTIAAALEYPSPGMSVLDTAKADQRASLADDLALYRIGVTRALDWTKALLNTPGLYAVAGPAGSGRTNSMEAMYEDLLLFAPLRKTLTISETDTRVAGAKWGFDESRNRALGLVRNVAPDIILWQPDVRNAHEAHIIQQWVNSGATVVVSLSARDVTGAYCQLTSFEMSPSWLEQHLRGVLAQRLVRGEMKPARQLVSECALFDGPGAIAALARGERTWQSILENALEKHRAGLISECDLVSHFGDEARRFLP